MVVLPPSLRRFRGLRICVEQTMSGAVSLATWTLPVAQERGSQSLRWGHPHAREGAHRWGKWSSWRQAVTEGADTIFPREERGRGAEHHTIVSSPKSPKLRTRSCIASRSVAGSVAGSSGSRCDR